MVSVAAIADRCGCSMIPAQEKIDVGETEETYEQEPVEEEEEAPEEEEQAEEEAEEEEQAEEASQEEGESAEESSQQQEQAEAPTVELVVYEGPIYSSSDNVCYFRIKANVTGTPSPDVEFSKDDSGGAWGELKCQINLNDPADTYTLEAIATNSEGSDSDTMDLTWGCDIPNNPPEITEIILPASDIYGSWLYEISVSAIDPDGDSLSYSWSVTGGSLADSNTNPVIWDTGTSGSDYDCEITVTVDDGNGGTDTEIIVVHVFRPIRGGSFYIPGESGYIERGIAAFPGQLPSIGDSDLDRPVRGFISFDISSWAGATILDADLLIRDSIQQGTPGLLISGYYIGEYYWGMREIRLTDYNAPGSLIERVTAPGNEIIVDSEELKERLQRAIDDGRQRFQLRIRHDGPDTNNNGIYDRWRYQEIRLHTWHIYE
jgi:hypothetical protein